MISIFWITKAIYYIGIFLKSRLNSEKNEVHIDLYFERKGFRAWGDITPLKMIEQKVTWGDKGREGGQKIRFLG